MRPFIHDDFLLHTDAARDLYHSFAKAEPIFDYHCHLPQQQILENHQFADLAEIWLGGDHYKWRAMRANGVKERFCTGAATPREKFDAWVGAVPHTLRNPLYHWSHLELARYFGIFDLINQKSADKIWREANEKLATMRVHDILAANKVAVICTTDDPADSLEQHEKIKKLGIKTRVYPTFRPDKALNVGSPAAYNAWLEKLAGAAKTKIASFDDFLSALKKRHDDFHAIGGRLSDHGMENCYAEPCTATEAQAIFDAARAGRAASVADQAKFASFMMLEFGRWDAKKGWTKQLHLGALRNNNTRLLATLGPDTGFDSIGDFPQTRALSRYLDTLDSTDELPRTVLYNLNPADNYAFATMIGNFQDGSVPGKMQFGSGWWFLDQKEAMEWQMNALSNQGLLSRFVGMLTDSRSFLSYTRHEYFRRTLCNLIGAEMERGEIPNDRELVGPMVRRICFANAREYFRLELDPSFRG
ncbi:glucuronate isomerase [Opitutus terrae]|uniref:Uronate isomerase n=1 Tax=Opitutus terrae (strain DSM 11246 / JCM 15787 / PB90-1) TaxID=452637 RepID=UXAC_OPITP|nr:glucuronate isomerase [Opitutus terrae]B1ZP77.1 RecName: Full=Uronate isomerase; AltName: Full=Glucuronate isomerase; AltName: Full=Uronic isomerase [Opitutus terrae PB90-1]ACB77566.1 Glucuronate isomerase [Opitutus terrae PB90-1]